jgi:hypothetical protein
VIAIGPVGTGRIGGGGGANNNGVSFAKIRGDVPSPITLLSELSKSIAAASALSLRLSPPRVGDIELQTITPHFNLINAIQQDHPASTISYTHI